MMYAIYILYIIFPKSFYGKKIILQSANEFAATNEKIKE